MSDLVDLVIEAHGGMDRWNQLHEVRSHLIVGGITWAVKQQAGLLDDTNVRIELHEQFASHYPFGMPGLHSSVTADRVAIERDSGEVVAERRDPRAAFAGHVLETPWDELHLAYFAGYAMWTYLTAPFSFASPGFRTEELEPWEEEGRSWRRLKVTFPAHIATHSAEQVFYVGPDRLIRRHDYNAEVVGGGPAAHYSADHREFDGIVVATTRRVHPLAADGSVAPEPLLVSIDLGDVRFQ
ncbi:hypothetical protein GCM10010464_07770 [Pseudonocardia yunnanensis]